MAAAIDWQALAESLGTLRDQGELVTDRHARAAIELLLGEDNLRQAVAYYISGEPGSELARSVLGQVRPWSAMQYCYDIFKSSAPIEQRRMAVELLRVLADQRARGWIPEILQDADEVIQTWGAGVLDALFLLDQLSGAEAEDLLKLAEHHVNPEVRKIANSIRERAVS